MSLLVDRGDNPSTGEASTWEGRSQLLFEYSLDILRSDDLSAIVNAMPTQKSPFGEALSMEPLVMMSVTLNLSWPQWHSCGFSLMV